ncbi:MAG: crossover junction endodeoxyribonuclease RuvC [Neomegalonema sp.]|nr:crossover junction endodeoxyribonuclease RuvC [Neomegalonema sp.]
MRVIGIDPGLRKMGWGIVDVSGSKLRHVGNGVITGTGDALSERLVALFRGLEDVLNAYSPTEAAVEHTFVNKDGAGTLKLGQARGVAMLVPGLFGLSVAEYAPNSVKKAVVGVGHAQKDQIAHMVGTLLPGTKIVNSDSADALAIAICHAYQAGSRARIAEALTRAR